MILVFPLVAYGEISLDFSFTSTPIQGLGELLFPHAILVMLFSHSVHHNFASLLKDTTTWELGLSDEAECCSFLRRAGLSLTMQDKAVNVALTLRELPFMCCGLTFDALISFPGPGRTLAIRPRWEGWWGPSLEIYGDPLRWEIYGWGVRFQFGDLHIRELVALNPERLQKLSQIPFYRGEREYWGMQYVVAPLTFTSEFWLGEGTTPFNLRRTKLSLVFPIYEGFEVLIEGEWDFSGTDPFDLLNIRWEVEF